MAKNKKDVRARTWTFILYPESAPENWRYILDGYHIPWVESPLHDKDVNPDGTVKKLIDTLFCCLTARRALSR